MFKIEIDLSVTFYKALVEDFLQIVNRIPQAQPYSRKMFLNQNYNGETLIMVRGKTIMGRLDLLVLFILIRKKAEKNMDDT